MNSAQANNINMPDLLSRLGHEPTSITKGGRELWYLSPLPGREGEKEASFHISRGRKWAWVWNDFGDIGGTVIDFIMRYKGYNRVREALSFLDNNYRGKALISNQNRAGESNTYHPNLFSSHSQKTNTSLSEEKELEFLSAYDIQNPLIFSYLSKERCIPKGLVKKYLKEVKYRNKRTNKEYFAFGMKNESGGYEIRAASDKYKFKSALKSRDITVIKGSKPERHSVNIFEGMTDYLSLLAMKNDEQFEGDAIVLHSLSSYKKAAQYLKEHDYKHIHTFLDNNPSGEKHTKRFCEEFGDLVTPQNHLFERYEDLNDALKANQLSNYLSR